jgi:hypothetical protein
MEDKGPNTEGQQPVTDYLTKYDLSTDQLSKIKDKFKKDKDFPNPSTDAEKEFALDWIIEQLVEVKKEQWGKPVKLD